MHKKDASNANPLLYQRNAQEIIVWVGLGDIVKASKDRQVTWEVKQVALKACGADQAVTL